MTLFYFGYDSVQELYEGEEGIIVRMRIKEEGGSELKSVQIY